MCRPQNVTRCARPIARAVDNDKEAPHTLLGRLVNFVLGGAADNVALCIGLCYPGVLLVLLKGGMSTVRAAPGANAADLPGVYTGSDTQELVLLCALFSIVVFYPFAVVVRPLVVAVQRLTSTNETQTQAAQLARANAILFFDLDSLFTFGQSQTVLTQ